MKTSRSLLKHRPASLVVRREPLRVKVAEQLRLLIREGELAPGTHLVESDLAALLGVSRAPVREALRILERERLVVINPDKGAIVTEWNLQDLLNLYDVRSPLEVKAMMLATEREADACVAALDDVLARWAVAVKTADREQCADLDFEFHRLIWQYADNRFLASALEQCIQPLQTVFYLNSTRYDDLPEVVVLHGRMRDAIASGDEAAARQAMEDHMRNSLAKARQHSEQSKS